MRVDGMPLRECPFCGKCVAGIRIFTPDGRKLFTHRYGVVCDYDRGGCGGAGGIYKTPQEAVAMWNQRKRRRKERTE